ncbi:BA75_05217T0 [Komagataella pastoris]|uniref:BA75_05217T0 n=1 Tax=Komagataella pastoris TaxID=4922 RepID=A0A1B2JHK0_PICPA|nr:BA75_05217T0 [Komagataella pastoris]
MKRTLDDNDASNEQKSTLIANHTLFRCTLGTCEAGFTDHSSLNHHLLQYHTYICQSCKKNFPNERFLYLHIQEHHNPFNSIKEERGEKIYQCLLETCDKICSSPQTRRLHMIDKHQYPRDFLYSVIRNGMSKGQTSLLKSR